MQTLELDDNTYENLVKYAAQAGKTPSQWLQELITQFQNKSRPVGLAKDKGIPLPGAFFEPLPDEFSENDSLYKNDKGEPVTVENQNFPDLSEFRKSLSSEKKHDESLLISDAFFESLENIKQPRTLLELIGKGKGCFKNALEIDAFIHAERDAWEK
ncbi:MAG: hypothetical protein WCP96_11845 [Methylococcaceae bacterium]